MKYEPAVEILESAPKETERRDRMTEYAEMIFSINKLLEDPAADNIIEDEFSCMSD